MLRFNELGIRRIDLNLGTVQVTTSIQGRIPILNYKRFEGPLPFKRIRHFLQIGLFRIILDRYDLLTAQMSDLCTLDSRQPAQTGFASPVSVHREGCMLGQPTSRSGIRQGLGVACG